MRSNPITPAPSILAYTIPPAGGGGMVTVSPLRTWSDRVNRRAVHRFGTFASTCQRLVVCSGT